MYPLHPLSIHPTPSFLTFYPEVSVHCAVLTTVLVCPAPLTPALRACVMTVAGVYYTQICAASPSGHPYKGLSFPKVTSEFSTQVLSRHSVWKNKIVWVAYPSVSCVCDDSDSQRPVSHISFPFHSSLLPMLSFVRFYQEIIRSFALLQRLIANKLNISTAMRDA